MYIATASTTVKFHEFPHGKLVHNYQPGTKVEGPMRSISWSKDGNWLSLVPYSGFAEIVSVKDQLKLIHTVQEIGEPSCVSFQTTSKRCIGLGTKNGQVLLYDIKSRSTKKRFPRATSMITHVHFTAKDSHCVAACSNGDVLLYSNTSNNLVYTFKVPKSNNVTALRTHVHKKNLILGGSGEGTVVVWDANVGKSKFCAEAHKAPVTAVAFSPITTMLVLTAGLDRQFRIYDIESKICVASVPLENTCTALDFTEDASHFALASQNGKVYIYDSRRVTEPVHSFEAHKSSIKHLAFQLQRDDLANTDSFCSVAEEVKPVRFDEEANKRTSELFDFALHGDSMTDAPTESPKPQAASKEAAGDSFLAALGFSNCNTGTFDSIRSDDSGRNLENNLLKVDKKSRSSVSCTPNPIKSIHEKIGLHDSKTRRTTSTPLVFSQQNLENVLSPIISVSQGQTPANIASVDIQSTIREAVKDELKNFDMKEVMKTALEEMKSTLLFQIKHSIHETRRVVLDLQMSMVREFMRLEDAVRDELNSGVINGNENYVLEENIELKRRVMFLEQQILNLENEVAILRAHQSQNENGI